MEAVIDILCLEGLKPPFHPLDIFMSRANLSAFFPNVSSYVSYIAVDALEKKQATQLIATGLKQLNSPFQEERSS